MATLLTVIVLFTASGTGIYGSLVNGMTGDATILISSQFLFLRQRFLRPTLALWSSNRRTTIYFLSLFYLGFIYPLTNPAMITDLKAVGDNATAAMDSV